MACTVLYFGIHYLALSQFFNANVVLNCLCCLPAGYQYLHGDHSEPGGGLGTIQSFQDCSQLHLGLCEHQRAGIKKLD